MAGPLVSVVIPTANRPELVVGAVRSALEQSVTSLEVIVVIDGPDPATREALDAVDDSRLTVATLPAAAGGGGARAAGIRRARGRWVALLDDDDRWVPRKLEIQLAAARPSAWSQPIVSCRLLARRDGGEFVWPRRYPRPGEPLSEYLFGPATPRYGEGVVHTSTILAPRALFDRVRFRDLRRHQDYDWLLRAVRVSGVGVVFPTVSEPLVLISLDPARPRLSRQGDWRQSLGWIRAHRRLVTPRAYAGFVFREPTLLARRAGAWTAFPVLLREGLQYGRPGVAGLLTYLARWLVPGPLQHRAAAGAARWAGSRWRPERAG